MRCLRLQSDCFDDDAGSPLSLIHPSVIPTAIPFTTVSFTAQFILPSSAESDQLHLSIHSSEVVKITPSSPANGTAHRPAPTTTSCARNHLSLSGVADRGNGTSDTSGVEWLVQCAVSRNFTLQCREGGSEEVSEGKITLIRANPLQSISDHSDLNNLVTNITIFMTKLNHFIR